MLNTIEDYREKFRFVPLGRWTSWFEYGPWPTVLWEFFGNGTGKIFRYTSSGDNELAFEWERAEVRTLNIRITDWGDDEDEDLKEALDKEGSGPWWLLRYDFKIIEHYSPLIVMYQTPENEMFTSWITDDDLRFEGDLEPVMIENSLPSSPQ